jgi:hypothetical protein
VPCHAGRRRSAVARAGSVPCNAGPVPCHAGRRLSAVARAGSVPCHAGQCHTMRAGVAAGWHVRMAKTVSAAAPGGRGCARAHLCASVAMPSTAIGSRRTSCGVNHDERSPNRPRREANHRTRKAERPSFPREGTNKQTHAGNGPVSLEGDGTAARPMVCCQRPQAIAITIAVPARRHKQTNTRGQRTRFARRRRNGRAANGLLPAAAGHRNHNRSRAVLSRRAPPPTAVAAHQCHRHADRR